MQPELDRLEGIYTNLDETAQSIAEGDDYTQTEAYKNAKTLANQ